MSIFFPAIPEQSGIHLKLARSARPSTLCLPPAFRCSYALPFSLLLYTSCLLPYNCCYPSFETKKVDLTYYQRLLYSLLTLSLLTDSLTHILHLWIFQQITDGFFNCAGNIRKCELSNPDPFWRFVFSVRSGAGFNRITIFK